MTTRRRPPQRNLENALVALALVGLAFSALLIAEYQSPGAVCSVGSGCDAVRTSAYSSVAGISLPALGVVYFLLLIGTAMVPASRVALAPLAAVGGVAGLTFVGVQAFAIGAFCSLCLVVDTAAIGAGVVGPLLRGSPAPALTTNRVLAVVGLVVLALSIPALMRSGVNDGAAVPPDASAIVPDFVARIQQQAEDVAIIEFVDFECPACRAQHQMFRRAFLDTDVPVHMVYLNLPLPMHEHAADAARAFVCADEAGYGPEMSEALFSSDDLSPRGIQTLAERVGLDASWYGRCLVARSTEERLQRDASYAQQAGVRSLPTFWIGSQRFVGVTEPAWLVDGIERQGR